jgi:hypothetical protein
MIFVVRIKKEDQNRLKKLQKITLIDIKHNVLENEDKNTIDATIE